MLSQRARGESSNVGVGEKRRSGGAGSSMSVVASPGWLEYFGDDANASFFAPVIEAVDDLLVPTISTPDVFERGAQQRGHDRALQAVAAMQQGRVVDLDPPMALSAAQLGLEDNGPSRDLSSWPQRDVLAQLSGRRMEASGAFPMSPSLRRNGSDPAGQGAEAGVGLSQERPLAGLRVEPQLEGLGSAASVPSGGRSRAPARWKASRLRDSSRPPGYPATERKSPCELARCRGKSHRESPRRRPPVQAAAHQGRTIQVHETCADPLRREGTGRRGAGPAVAEFVDRQRMVINGESNWWFP